MAQREQLASRLGFLFLSAGCAIGLGNVWRFPFITGKYGGAVFLVAYLVFLLGMGLPILIMEFTVGRASRRNMSRAFCELKPGSKWSYFGCFSIIGSYALMMFYIPVSGWMMYYCWATVTGTLSVPMDQVAGVFSNLLSSPGTMLFWTLVASFGCFGVCALGLQKGVERVVKIMMGGLLVIVIGLAVHSLTLPGGMKGVAFYLVPDLQRAMDAGIMSLINDAMNQAFFTLSIGIGAMCIFGSYLDRSNTLTKESVFIVSLDTFVAFMSGLIIFPACFAFGVQPDAGPSLIFITLPNIFNNMAWGRLWGALFFVFMSAAALTTVIAVLENIISHFMDTYEWSRKKAVKVNCIVLTLCTLPCILGFNLWSDIQPLGAGSTIMDLEDFVISNNLLPLGSLIFCLFCCQRYGWGWDKFIAEADTGAGMKFPKALRFYLTWILPVVLLVIFVEGYIQKFF
ncbi:sodium-dependent transporter [uncultured Mailhella sp.]|uniref:sodium-dependent transporter n=1 Tax=uncultured Mailhella sp. TaxID=1981031 RepID=UPI0025F8206F|nr:sodium-dependent transporter [uncultured Mailhella sp.]